MRDLYKRLGYSYSVDTVDGQRIAVIQRDDPRLASACRHILQDQKRKSVYDRNRRVLDVIGYIRADLGLLRDPNWTELGCTDFDRHPTRVGDARPINAKATVQASGRSVWYFNLMVILFAFFVLKALLIPNVNERDQSTEVIRYLSNTEPSRKKTEPSTHRPLSRPTIVTKPKELSDKVVVSLDSQSLIEKRRLPQSSVKDGEEPLLKTGIVGPKYFRGDAPLELASNLPQEGENFYVKIARWINGHDVVLTVFVRNGDRFRVSLPEGSYQVRYATGSTWYGTERLFGSNTFYAKSKKHVRIYKTVSPPRVETIELCRPHWGDARTTIMHADDF